MRQITSPPPQLINVVRNNNQLIAPGEVRTAQGTFAVGILASYDGPRDIYALPVNTNGDRVVTLGDLAQIRVAFDDRLGTAGFNGATTVARQVMTRKGVHLLDITTLERTTHEKSPRPVAETAGHGGGFQA